MHKSDFTIVLWSLEYKVNDKNIDRKQSVSDRIFIVYREKTRTQKRQFYYFKIRWLSLKFSFKERFQILLKLYYFTKLCNFQHIINLNELILT